MSTSTPAGPGTAPSWVRLEREGATVRALSSDGGSHWTLVATDTLALPAAAFAGLAVSSHTPSTAAAASFDDATIEAIAPPPPPTDVPAGWSHGDIGAVGAAGSTAFDSAAGTVRVTGAGADVWGSADAFHFAWRPWSGATRYRWAAMCSSVWP